MFSLIAVLVSILALIFSEASTGDEGIINLIDEIIKYSFLAEVVIKLIGLGFEKYF